jgi:glycopeptide antibiotics resistance protein
MIINFKAFLGIAVPIWIIFRIIKMRQMEIKNLLNHEIVVNLLFMYLLYLAQMTIFPLNIGIPIERRVSLIPFRTIMQLTPILLKHGLMTNAHESHLNAGAINIIGNIIVFIPVGILIPLISKRVTRFKTTIMLGFTTSFVIEIVQFLSVEGRIADIDDLILNTLGVAIGWGIFKTIKFLIRRNHESISI